MRIWVNSELEEIEQALKSSLNVLAPGGRLSIISFHSLEDRIVKRFMRENSRGPQVPAGLPMTEEQLKKLGGRQLRALGKLMPGEEGWLRTLVPVVQFCVLQRGRMHDQQSDRSSKQS